jgi:hypothetical protein
MPVKAFLWFGQERSKAKVLTGLIRVAGVGILPVLERGERVGMMGWRG